MCLDPYWQEKNCQNKWDISSTCLWEIPTNIDLQVDVAPENKEVKSMYT